MEPFEEHELSDGELDALLPEWKAPAAPARLRAAVFPEAARPWWKNLWSASIRIPVPVALCMAILLAAWWQWSARGPSHAVIQEQQAQVQPVAELQPRIIRRGHVPN